MLDLSTNRPLLEELASKSGGKVYTPEDVQELVERLVSQSIPETEYTEQKLWQWWVVLRGGGVAVDGGMGGPQMVGVAVTP